MFAQSSATRSILISIGFVTILLAAMLFLDADEQVLLLLQWLEHKGLIALLWFVLIMALVVVLLLPGILLTTGAGFVFGVAQGTVAVVLGTSLGAFVALLIARHLLGERAREYILSRGKMKTISSAVSLHGFRIVLLTRLIPFFPSKLANYLFGLTHVTVSDFLRASVLGFIPYSLHNVYLGSIAADIATLGSRNSERTPLEWVLYGLGFTLTIAIVVYVSRLASRILDEDLGEENQTLSVLNAPGEDTRGGGRFYEHRDVD